MYQHYSNTNIPMAHPSKIHPLNLSTLLEYNHSPLLSISMIHSLIASQKSRSIPQWYLTKCINTGIQISPTQPLNDSPNQCINTTGIQSFPTPQGSTHLIYQHFWNTNIPHSSMIHSLIASKKSHPTPQWFTHLMYQHYWNTIIPHPSMIHSLYVSQTSLPTPQ